MSELSNKYLKLEADELTTLAPLLRMSKDDPRINGLIGTCFWSHAYSKEEEAELLLTCVHLVDELLRQHGPNGLVQVEAQLLPCAAATTPSSPTDARAPAPPSRACAISRGARL